MPLFTKLGLSRSVGAMLVGISAYPLFWIAKRAPRDKAVSEARTPEAFLTSSTGVRPLHKSMSMLACCDKSSDYLNCHYHEGPSDQTLLQQ